MTLCERCKKMIDVEKTADETLERSIERIRETYKQRRDMIISSVKEYRESYFKNETYLDDDDMLDAMVRVAVFEIVSYAVAPGDWRESFGSTDERKKFEKIFTERIRDTKYIRN